MKKFLFAFFTLFLISADAQKYIGKTRAEIEKKFRESKPDATVSKSDSTLTFSSDAEFVFYFSPEGKCRAEVVTFPDQPSFKPYFDRILKRKKYRWRKINGNQFISKYKAKLLLESDPDQLPRFWILRTTWNRKTYKMLGDQGLPGR